MKRIAAMLSAALVLSLAAPAFAAVEFGGKLATEFELHEVAGDWRLDGRTGLDIETEVNAEGGDPVKAVVQFKPWRFESGFNDDGDPIDPFETEPSSIGLTNLSIDKAWIETEGAYWNGGPSVLTRIGDVTVNWNDYVGYLDDKRGVTVSGMPVGPASLSAFYAWDNADGSRPYGIAGSATVEGIDLNGILVRKGDVNNYALNGSMNLMPGVEVSADVALDGENDLLYRAEAKLDSIVEGVTLTAAYRFADDDFLPAYTIPAEDEDGNVIGTGTSPADRNHEDNVNYDLRDGFSVSAETTQSGVHMVAAYDQPTQVANFAADTVFEGFELAGEAELKAGEVQETELSVGRGFNLAGFDVNAEYVATFVPGTEIEHTVSASTRTPNGIDLGVEYNSIAGASATAGVTVEF